MAYDASTHEIGDVSSGGGPITAGGGISAPAIQKGSSWVPLAVSFAALFVAVGIAYVALKKR